MSGWRARFGSVLILSLATILSAGVFWSGATAAAADPGSVTTDNALVLSATSALLQAVSTTVAPGDIYLFDYGTSTAFGSVAAASGSGESFYAQLNGLSPGSTYYFQFREIVGGSQTLTGGASSFTTPPAPPGGNTSAPPPSSTTTVPAGTTTTTVPRPATSTLPGSTTTAPGSTTTPSSSTTTPGAPSSGGPPSIASAGSAADIVPVNPTPDGRGYWQVTAPGQVLTFGDATYYGAPVGLDGQPTNGPLQAPVTDMVSTPDGQGYWLVAGDGGVFAYGDAGFYGSAAGTALAAPVVGIQPTPDGQGYWLVAGDGGVFAYGDAVFYGSGGGGYLDAPVLGMTATPDGQGYWLSTSDGQVLAYGDATYYGSPAGMDLSAPIARMVATPDGKGYWLVGSDGGVFAYGDATFFGSASNLHPVASIVGLVPTADDQGYWLVGSDGGVFAFGDAVFYGASAPNSPARVVGMALPLVNPISDIPAELVVLDHQAAATCTGLSWTILAAIGKVESDFGRSTLPGVRSGTNSAGAAGPMQMGIGGAAGPTFQAYDHPVPADVAATPIPPGSTPPNPYNPADAVYAAARDLCTNGAGRSGSLNSAILAYNHAQWYATEVETLAAQYGGSSTFGAGTTPLLATAVNLAMSQIGTPYQWGGTTPGIGFDCSGLVQWAYNLAGIRLPRTSEEQWAALTHLPVGAPLQVGDLLFFEPAPDGPGHVGIYVGNGLMLNAPHTGADVRVEPYSDASFVGAAIP